MAERNVALSPRDGTSPGAAPESAATFHAENEREGAKAIPVAWLALAGLSALRFIASFLVVTRYGYFRDELYYIACSKHLAWGFVDQPPLSLAVLAANRALFGDSLPALRWLPILAGAASVLLSGLLARKLGAGRFGQALTALSVALAPVMIGTSRVFSMNAFDVLLWAAAMFVLAVILADDRPGLWPLFGAIAGLGLLNKYSMGFLLAGAGAGLLLSRQRRHLAKASFWIGMAIAGAMFLPHVVWEIRNGVPSLEFMRNAALLKNAPQSPLGMLAGLWREGGFAQALLFVPGIAFFFGRRGSRFRPFGWMFLVVLLIMIVGRGKPYYVAPAFPAMFAGGAVLLESAARRAYLRWLKPAALVGVAALSVAALPFAIPVLPVDIFIRYERALGMTPRSEERISLGELPQHYADMFGWEEWARVFGAALERLTPAERADCFIYARNYGEAGALDFFGPRYGLPPAGCPHNSYWFWGPPKWDGRVGLIVGTSGDLEECLEDLRPHFESVELAGTVRHPYAVPYENGRMVFICRGFKHTVDTAFWKKEKEFI